MTFVRKTTRINADVNLCSVALSHRVTGALSAQITAETDESLAWRLKKAGDVDGWADQFVAQWVGSKLPYMQPWKITVDTQMYTHKNMHKTRAVATKHGAPSKRLSGGPSHHHVLTKMLYILRTQRQISYYVAYRPASKAYSVYYVNVYCSHYSVLMYKTAVYTLVNGVITHQKQHISKKWYYAA